jgi:hypothetical protein
LDLVSTDLILAWGEEEKLTFRFPIFFETVEELNLQHWGLLSIISFQMINNYEPLAIPSLQFDPSGELIIAASPISSKEDFDFYQGKWKVQNFKLKTRLNNCNDWIEFNASSDMQKILNGSGNIDKFLADFDGDLFEGLTLRLFDPVTRLWSIYWADTSRGKLDPPVLGSFDQKIGHFLTKDTFENKPIIMVFCWDARSLDQLVWSQAFSEDQGKTWEWNWYMFMSRE